MWVGTVNGLGFFDGEEWQRFSTDDDLPSNEITTLAIDQAGQIIVGTSAGAAIQVDGDFFTIPQSADNTISSVLQSLDGQYLITGEEPGLIRFDPATGEGEAFPDTYYWSGAAKDEQGNLYFGTYEGIVHSNSGNVDFWSGSNSPSQDDYNRILLAPDNWLWFINGTHVDTFDPATESWARNELVPCCSEAITFDDSGRVWAGSYGELWLLSNTEQIQLTQADGLPDGYIYSVAFFPDGGVALGTESGVMLMQNDRPDSLLTAESDGFASNKVYVVFIDSQATLWVGTEFGLSHLLADNTWQHYTIGNPFGDGLGQIVDIAEGPDGAIWIATAGDGLYRFAEDQFQRFMSENPESNLPPPYLHAVAVAATGEVWVGADYGGLYRFDGENWDYFGVEAGLVSNNVQDILITPDGTVWTAGTYGVSKYTP